MDNATHCSPVVAQAVVVHANHRQFAADDEVHYSVVHSRALVWCLSGFGSVQSRGRSFELRPGHVLVLPWRYDVRYRPLPDDPFLLGTAQIIPWHDPDAPIEPLAAHGEADPLTLLSTRRDVSWPGFEEPRLFVGRSASMLMRLGEVAVEQLPERDRDDGVMRALGVLLARAVTVLASEDVRERDLPQSLLRMQDYARSHLYQHLDAPSIARIGNCSVSTAERQFRQHTAMSPMGWVREERLQLAARLLRTSNRRVAEVSAIAGFPDSTYFARLFRRRFGVSPRAFGRRRSGTVEHVGRPGDAPPESVERAQR